MDLLTMASPTYLAWLAAGTLLGVGGMLLAQRLAAWREARRYEWDPY